MSQMTAVCRVIIAADLVSQAPVEHEAALRKILDSNMADLERQAQGLTDSLRAADTVMHVTEPPPDGVACGVPAKVATVVPQPSGGACAACSGDVHTEVELTEALEEFLEISSSVAYERQQLGRYNERLCGLERVAKQAEEMLKDLQCGTGVVLQEPSV